MSTCYAHLDVDATAGDVGGDEDLELATLETVDGLSGGTWCARGEWSAASGQERERSSEEVIGGTRTW